MLNYGMHANMGESGKLIGLIFFYLSSLGPVGRHLHLHASAVEVFELYRDNYIFGLI